MSWDRFDYTETSNCACGKGKVTRHSYREDDDWNRTRYGTYGMDIECPECKSKYHIESITRHYFCPSWKGDGVSVRTYLVPNGFTIPAVISARTFVFSKIDERIVAEVPYDGIKAALDDMVVNKYTTRLQSPYSRQIVQMFKKALKKTRLSFITPVLAEILNNYDSYKWTFEKISQFRITERERIESNEAKIAEVLKKSFELNFQS